jgi:hypothetical protein
MGGKASRAWRVATRRAERDAKLAEESIFILLVTVVDAMQHQHGQEGGTSAAPTACALKIAAAMPRLIAGNCTQLRTCVAAPSASG